MNKDKNFFKAQERLAKIKAFLLVSPLLLFVLVFFVTPILLILVKAVYNPKVNTLIPKTVVVIKQYDYKNIFPKEQVLKVFLTELQVLSKNRTSGVLAEELNRKVSGFGSTIKKTARKIKKKDISKIPNYKEYLLSITKKWNNPKFWIAIQRSHSSFTFSNILAAVDLEYDLDGNIVRKEESKRIYFTILVKTIYMAALITFFTIILGYPTAYFLASLPKS
jgi:putative spermidine/putrescine transport system permease protein